MASDWYGKTWKQNEIHGRLCRKNGINSCTLQTFSLSSMGQVRCKEQVECRYGRWNLEQRTVADQKHCWAETALSFFVVKERYERTLE